MENTSLSQRIKDYQTRFIKNPDRAPARFGKSVYIRKEHHERISQIVHIIGGSDITLSDYIDNVLTQHFENYNEEITHSFNKYRIF
jgi:hypothetical protein